MQPGIVTADKLRRMKCPVCGSKDKNTDDIVNSNNERILKVLACNQCGYLTMFGLSAAVVRDILAGTVKDAAYYDKAVHDQHEGNHPE